MIHYTCDGCGRTINLDDETRYVVRLEVYAAIDDDDAPDVVDVVDEEDHLDELEDLLERMDELDEDEDQRLYRQARYDLCPQCRERFVRNPVGRGATRLGFSDN
ncbi:hypothetical protein [Botrimarina sp.]|uniref:hypothetical protein n=1 Tax=Botrimarina sp. TaxID=2795802 RepID=UPI0032EC995C